jgi:hypothetical protein
MELEAVRYFTDSSAVLGMLSKDTASFLELGTRVSEIRIKSDPDKEWFWIPGELNLADQGTRPTVLPRDMAPGTPYKDGLQWMRGLVEAWPVKKKFSTPPAEECRKDVLKAAGGVRAAPGLVYPARATTRAKLERIYGYVFAAIACFKRLPAFSPVEIRAEGRTKKGPWAEYGLPAEKYRTAARQFLLQDAQAGLVEKQFESLMVEKKPQREEGFPERMIIMIGGRQKKHLKVAYDQKELLVLPPDHDLAQLYLQEAHERDHAGVDAMIMRSRSQVWSCEESLLHVQETREGVGKPADGPSTCPQDGANAALLVHGRGSVPTALHRQDHEQVNDQKGVGRDLRVHCNVPDARGDSGVILDRGISTGTEEIHGAVRGPQAVSVRSRNTAGRSLQAGEGMGLGESAPSG